MPLGHFLIIYITIIIIYRIIIIIIIFICSNSHLLMAKTASGPAQMERVSGGRANCVCVCACARKRNIRADIMRMYIVHAYECVKPYHAVSLEVNVI